MKKIGIVTITDYNNYGNRYQNIATDFIMKNLGHSPVSLLNDPNEFKPLTLKIKHKLKNLARRILKGKQEIDINERRHQNFVNFSKKHMTDSVEFITKKTQKQLSNQFDYFLVGSDQVWNPNYRHHSSFDFLTFAKDNQKLSSAASIGLSSLSNSSKRFYKKHLKSFKDISVREEQAKDILNDIGITNVEAHLDPTLMMNSKDWDGFSTKVPELTNEKYLLLYFLGDITEEIQDFIDFISKEKGIKVIRFNDENTTSTYEYGPDELLYAINKSSFVISDSFHLMAFSVIYKIPFVIFDQNRRAATMSSRIDNLGSKLNMSHRKYDPLTPKENYLNIDFTGVEELLEKEKEKYYNYLKKNII